LQSISASIEGKFTGKGGNMARVVSRCAAILNHTAPCAVKRAGIVDDIGLDHHSPQSIGAAGAIL
jgi:hypothetical protein